MRRPQAEPSKAGSSSLLLVLLALTPRAAQGERSCHSFAWSHMVPVPPHISPRQGRFHSALGMVDVLCGLLPVL